MKLKRKPYMALILTFDAFPTFLRPEKNFNWAGYKSVFWFHHDQLFFQQSD